MKTKNIFILFLVLFLTKSMVSQNPVWSLPPYYLDNLNNLNLLPSFGVYSGQQAEITHNSYAAANGNILFFIVDDMLYTDNGAFPLIFSGQSKFTMGTEVMIVPFENDCNKFYLFYSLAMSGSPSTGFTDFAPIYGILDLDDNGAPSFSGPDFLVNIPSTNHSDFITVMK